MGTKNLIMRISLTDEFRALLAKKRYTQAEELAVKEKALHELLNLMANNVDYKFAFTLLKKYKLPLDDFPGLRERAMKKCVRYLKLNSEWQQVELRLLGQKHLLAILAEDLFYRASCPQNSKRFNSSNAKKSKAKVETMFGDDDEESSNLTTDLKQNENEKCTQDFNLAFSLVQRHELRPFLMKKEIIEALDTPFTYMENIFLTQDIFGFFKRTK